MESIKDCQICGDKAVAKNFGVISCESCKVFFRRNASKIEEFKCIYKNKCEINLQTRKKCRKCRINKCFHLGMKKEWIMDEHQKQIRYNLIEENRRRKSQKCELKSSQTMINDLSDEVFSISEESEDKKEISKVNSLGLSLDSSIMKLLINCNNFTESEANILSELLNAMNFNENNNSIVGQNNITSEIETINEVMKFVSIKWDEEFRNLIKSAKNLIYFKNISNDDQYSLFKYGSSEIAFMRSILFYEQQTQYLIYPLDFNNSTKISVEVYKQKSLESYVHGKFCIDKLAYLTDCDITLLYLLTAIILFMPTRPQLTNRTQIRFHQQIYIHLLKRYLQLKYGSGSESLRRFSKLIELVSDIHFFTEKHIREYYESMPSDSVIFKISPLLKEIYKSDALF